MIKLLLLLKHHFPFIWRWIENINGLLVGYMYEKRVVKTAVSVLSGLPGQQFTYRLIEDKDLPDLCSFFSFQPEEAYRYFQPHDFDLQTLRHLLKNPSFLMMGVFEEKTIIGYFFLRFFLNKHCFTGYLVDCEHQGRGIAKCMGRSMFEIAWSNGFRTFATVSRANTRALSAYRAINDFRIIKNLPDDYIYIEYLRDKVK